MSTRRKNMTDAQRTAVSNIARLKQEHTQKKAEIKRRIALAEREELAQLENSLHLAVRRAKQMGVTVTVISNDGLGLVDRAAAYRMLKATEDMEYAAHGEAAGVFAWADEAQTEIVVNYPNFPTAAIGAEDYPVVLEGTVKMVNGEISVLSDPMTEQTPEGELPGWLTFELEEATGSLGAMIREWVEAQA